MNVDQLKKHYKVKTMKALTSIVGKSKGTLSLWNANGIPPEYQAVIQIRTNNKLIADLSDLKPLPETKTTEKL